jgi:hypothetical protein
VLEAFRGVNQEFGVTIVMVTHDLLARRADRSYGSATAAVRRGRPWNRRNDGRARLPDAVDALAGLTWRPRSRGRGSDRRRGERIAGE